MERAAPRKSQGKDDEIATIATPFLLRAPMMPRICAARLGFGCKSFGNLPSVTYLTDYVEFSSFIRNFRNVLGYLGFVVFRCLNTIGFFEEYDYNHGCGILEIG